MTDITPGWYLRDVLSPPTGKRQVFINVADEFWKNSSNAYRESQEFKAHALLKALTGIEL